MSIINEKSDDIPQLQDWDFSPDEMDMDVFSGARSLLTEQHSDATKRKNIEAVRKFCEFAASVGETRTFHEIPPKKLASVMCLYFMKAKRKYGKDYEPSSLSDVFSS